ncbi:unnamed protein product [Prunus armeniaca]|uniref:Ubiquitin-like domain-containing protein n=1 Tax=Prunus armeniaca TaxID=36596 RepID=A0A6J5WNH3_PRUAR|nr:unnamed protein product [Prunus armeniaca]
MDEQPHLPGQESPSFYKKLDDVDLLFIDDLNGGRTVVEGQVEVNDDNVVGDDPNHGQGVATNDGNVVGDDHGQGQGVPASDGNEVRDNQLTGGRLETVGECYKLVVVHKGHNDEVIEVNKFGNVASIKNQIENLLRISAIQQVLFFNRQYLDEDSLIIESIEGLASNSRIELFEFEPLGEAATATASTSAAQPSSAAAAGVHFPPETHRREPNQKFKMNVILSSSVDIDTPNPSITEIRQNTRQQLITNIVDSTKLMFVSSSGQELDDYLSLRSNLNKEIKILLEPSAMGMASLTTTTGAMISTSAPMPPSTSAPPQTSASAAGGESSRVNPSMRHTVRSKRAAPDPASRSAPDDEHTESDASASLPSTSSSLEYVLSPSASSSFSEYVLSSPSIEGSAPATRYSLRPRR